MTLLWDEADKMGCGEDPRESASGSNIMWEKELGCFFLRNSGAIETILVPGIPSKMLLFALGQNALKLLDCEGPGRETQSRQV